MQNPNRRSGTPTTTTIAELSARYTALLFDAYGVLVDRSGPLPGAAATLRRLREQDRPFWVLSNSASRLPQTMAADLQALGLPIDAEQIITSGTLLASCFREHGLQGSRCLVLGPDDAATMCREAGGEVVPLASATDAETIVIADQKGFDLLAGMDAALTVALQRLDAGTPLHLILCNPDLIYPVAERQYGFTSGGLALMLEGVLRDRYPDAAHRFIRLGKPHAPIFAEAIRRAGTHDVVMIGDQLATDILGANRFEIASALIRTGLARADVVSDGEAVPDYLLADLVFR